MKTTLIAEINETMDELMQTFSSFSQEQIDKTPFEGSWTAGEVAEHITKSIIDLPQLFAHQTMPTTGRNFDAKVAAIRALFLDFSSKMKSPDFILPQEKYHDKQKMLDTFDQIKTQTINAASAMDLTLTCQLAEFPGMGFLTVYEWLNFAIVHTKRHTHQMKGIAKALNQ